MSRTPARLIALVAWLTQHFEMIEFVGRPTPGDGWAWLDFRSNDIQLMREGAIKALLDFYNVRPRPDAFQWFIAHSNALYIRPVVYFDESEAVP